MRHFDFCSLTDRHTHTHTHTHTPINTLTQTNCSENITPLRGITINSYQDYKLQNIFMQDFQSLDLCQTQADLLHTDDFNVTTYDCVVLCFLKYLKIQ